MIKPFPINPIIEYASFKYTSQTHGELTIGFKKTFSRVYLEVPRELFYKIFYMENAGTMIGFYSKNIRRKFKSLTK